MRFKNSKRMQRGMSLLEVLVAVVVFAIGLLAIASLQGSLFRNGGLAKARTVATTLAEDRIEEARSFIDTGDFDNIAGTAEQVSESGVEYRRSTTVTDYYYADTGLGLVEGVDPDTGKSEAKLISVTVSWCDVEGGAACDPSDLTTEPNTIAVQDIISRSSTPIGSARTLVQLTNSDPPSVPYQPGEAPAVISIDLGDGSQRESPEPTLQTTRTGSQDSEALNVNTLTRLSAITYNTLASGEVTVQRQEFIAANCTCQQEGVPASAEDYGYTPLVWDGDDWVGREQVAKPVGSSTLGSSGGSQLQVLCSDCCRDHHDANGGTFDYDLDGDGELESGETADLADYNPFQNNPLPSGDHRHFNGSLSPADSVGDTYLEACRFARVDGELQLTTDFRLESFKVLPATSSEVNDPANQPFQDWIDEYRLYIEDFLDAYATAVGNESVNYPTETPQQDDPSTPAVTEGPLPSGQEPEYSLPTTDSFNSTSETRTLVARALYLDYLHPIVESRIKCRLGISSPSNCRDRDVDDGDGNLPPVLPILPFAEVNVALQANWDTSGGDWVNVTDQPVANPTSDGEPGYSRGDVTRNTSGSGQTTVGATIEQGNVGLTDSHEITPFDCSSFEGVFVDGLRYNSGGGVTFSFVSRGCVKFEPSLIEGNRVNPSDVIVTNGAGVDCGSLLGDNFYECKINSDGSGEIIVTGYSRNSNNNNKVCLETNAGVYDGGVVENDGTRDDVTTFTLDPMASPSDRTHTLFVVPQNGGNVNCTPNILN